MPRRQIPIRSGGRTLHITPDQLIELRQEMARAEAKRQHVEEECFCVCHDAHDSRHLHADPCCRVCPDCGVRVLIAAVEAHAARHLSREEGANAA